MTVAELPAETLHAVNVQRVFAVAGDSLNGFTDALCRQRGMAWIHVRRFGRPVAGGAGDAAGQ